jgi:pyruvate,orthophosphate dikinase
MRNLLGGKGANLAEMTSIGLPVPQGFTITTEACTQYYEDGRKINDEIMAQTMEGVKKMEELNGKKFGDLKNPLLVSVRSGARASMPGMMDTILNLGLNDEVVAAMIAGNPDPKFERFVYDSYRRFIQMFSDVVMEVGKKYFEQLIDKMKEEKGVQYDIELTAADLKTLAEQFKAEYKKQLGEDFPSDPVVQLKLAIEAVFRSWDNPRANVYRRDNDIPYSWGTAVNVMPMVFGNLNDESGTGVAFTRDPATGEKKLMGEFLKNAQGEDVVAGVRTPMPIAQMEQEFPEAYRETLVVLDGTTGQNALSQARQFMEVADITGIILTKLDGTAKGGIAVAIQSELGIPVKYVGVGEKIDDLQKFNAGEFVNALFHVEEKEEA